MATEICATPVIPMSFAPNYGYGTFGGGYGSDRCDTSCLESLITSNVIHQGHGKN
jgi:hypothetical protein